LRADSETDSKMFWSAPGTGEPVIDGLEDPLATCKVTGVLNDVAGKINDWFGAAMPHLNTPDTFCFYLSCGVLKTLSFLSSSFPNNLYLL
jgi:hypothetical protein